MQPHKLLLSFLWPLQTEKEDNRIHGTGNEYPGRFLPRLSGNLIGVGMKDLQNLGVEEFGSVMNNTNPFSYTKKISLKS